MNTYGPRFPLKPGNSDTFEPYEDVKEQISFYLKNLILTSPGENISDPNYGVGLRRFLFEPNTGNLRSSISFEISNQISIYLPYLTVESIDVFSQPEDVDNNLLNVKITYLIPNNILKQVFELNVGEGTTIGFY